MGYRPGMEVPFYPRVQGFGNAAPTARAMADSSPGKAGSAAVNRAKSHQKSTSRTATRPACRQGPGYDDGA
jgi:hypothetical protein